MARLRRLFSSPTPVPTAPPVFSLPDGMRVYAIGDIHGRSDLLQKMLVAIARDAAQHPGKRIVEVFLGDYVDRGMQSREVIDMLLVPPSISHERVFLKGNHEETLLAFLEDPTVLRSWANYGGYATLASYGIAIPPSMSPEKMTILRDTFQKNLPTTHLEFLKTLRLTYQLGNYAFAHAGVVPHVPFAQQPAAQLLWIRETFLRHTEYFDHYIVHGHSPIAAPEVLHHRANLDVSAAPIDSLACLVIEKTDRHAMVVTARE